MFSFLRDFRTIYAFDATDAEFPEPIGYFADDREKYEFVKKKILLQDIALHLGNTFGEYHVHKINTEGALPAIEGKRLAINYREIYCKAMADYVETFALWSSSVFLAPVKRFRKSSLHERTGSGFDM